MFLRLCVWLCIHFFLCLTIGWLQYSHTNHHCLNNRLSALLALCMDNPVSLWDGCHTHLLITIAPITGVHPVYNTSRVCLFLYVNTHHRGISNKSMQRIRGSTHKRSFSVTIKFTSTLVVLLNTSKWIIIRYVCHNKAKIYKISEL